MTEAMLKDAPMRRLTPLLLLLVSFVAPGQLSAHTPAQDMADTAQNLLAMLTPEQKAKLTFEFDHAERANWFFTPVTRKGLTLKEMTTPQRDLAYALLSSALSQRGFMKAATIMSLEQTLGELEGPGRANPRDPEDYHLTFFGQPSNKDPWGWRWEGHHLSLSFTIVAGEIVTNSPTFMGSNPAEVKDGPRAQLFILNDEDTLGFKLINALTPEQQKTAIFSTTAPNEIITSNNHEAKRLDPPGLAMAQMTPAQQAMLMELLNVYLNRFRPELAAEDLKQIEAATPAKIYFAWAGGLKAGQGHYYRIQGPAFLVEFDNTQNQANHIHSVWRDLNKDFGADPLRDHYEKYHNATLPGTGIQPAATTTPAPTVSQAR